MTKLCIFNTNVQAMNPVLIYLYITFIMAMELW